MSSALTFKAIRAGYRNTVVLNDLTFDIPEGEMTAVIGPNGSGKTTLLRVATAFIKPMDGAVSLFDRNADTLPPAERARLVGVVPQSVETPMDFTVGEIVMTGRTASLSRWRQPSAEDRAIAERAMAYTDTADMKNRSFAALSGGEKQRAVIAMVLAQQPRMILMDEATSHLDMNHRLEVMEIVERLNREAGVTVVMVSHDLNLAAEFCRRLLLLDNGRLAADGAPENVLTERILADTYHCDVRVGQDQTDGSLLIKPVRRT